MTIAELEHIPFTYRKSLAQGEPIAILEFQITPLEEHSLKDLGKLLPVKLDTTKLGVFSLLDSSYKAKKKSRFLVRCHITVPRNTLS